MATTPLPSVSDVFVEAIAAALPVVAPVMIGIGAVMVFVGVVRLVLSGLQGAPSSGESFIGMGAAQIAAGFMFPWMFELIFDLGDAPNPEPTASATPSVTPSATPPASPADLSWLWVTLGSIIGSIIGVILLVLLVAVVTHVVGRAIRAGKASRARAAALRAKRDRLITAWQSFHDKHNDLLRKILHSETDWDSLFFLPALTDPNIPATYAMLRAMRTANTLRDTAGEQPADLDDESVLTDLPYPRAVLAFEVAWDAAERNARRLGQKGIPAAERKLIKEIRTLLDLAENSAASQTERTLSYRRAQTLIASLESVHIPPKAIHQLEERQQLMLTPGQ